MIEFFKGNRIITDSNLKKLKPILEKLYQIHQKEALQNDPLIIVRQFKNTKDQEIAGFIASMMALGRADLIQKAVREILNRMDQSPFDFVQNFNPEKDRGIFKDFSYRFYKENDIGLLVSWLAQMVRSRGSIRETFLVNYEKKDIDIGPSLSRFVKLVGQLDTKPYYSSLPRKGSGASHFLVDPETGSGCKRLNLFLRWMVRKDNIDLGLWSEVKTSQLIIPLDTHIVRLGKRIGLTTRSSPDWAMAREITENLKRLEPDDPVKYDFALCTLGKQQSCPDSPHSVECVPCPLHPVCLV